MSEAFDVLIDGRSAAANRMSGWERYTRALVSAAMGLESVTVRAVRSESAVKRVLDDWISVPNAARSAKYVHYPSFPPAPVMRRSRAIATIHDLTWWKYPETASTGGRLYYRQMMKRQFSAALVVTVTQAIADEIRDLDPSANVEIVSPAVQLLHVQPVPKHVTTKPYYLAVGSIEPRKNLKALATAFELSRLQNDFDLVLVGRQAWGELPRGVIATGVISDGELRYMMERAVGLVCPSLYEGFGLPVAEAVSLGTAVACSDIPALREVAPEANIFFDPTDVHAMSEALIKLAHLEPGSAEKSARTPFTLSRMREQLIQAYAAVGLTVG